MARPVASLSISGTGRKYLPKRLVVGPWGDLLHGEPVLQVLGDLLVSQRIGEHAVDDVHAQGDIEPREKPGLPSLYREFASSAVITKKKGVFSLSVRMLEVCKRGGLLYKAAR